MDSPADSPADSPEDMRDLARGLTRLLETAARTLDEHAVPSKLVRRLTAHLGCDLPELVCVTERFAI